MKAQLRLRQHEDTIAEWPECIGDDRVVRREAARLLGQSGGRPQPPPGSRTSWPWGRGADAGNWPPLGERAELGRRLTGHFGPRHPMVLDDGTTVTFPGLADRVGRPAFDDLRLRLLRTALEPRVAAWFRDAQDTELAIWFRNNIAENWSGHDLFADHLPPLGRRMPSNAKYPAAVATAAQLLAWRISGDREAVADAVRRLVMARSAWWPCSTEPTGTGRDGSHGTRNGWGRPRPCPTRRSCFWRL
ncbi:hypothetical protein ACFQZC_01405 [Streptacidiphilus monticola]